MDFLQSIVPLIDRSKFLSELGDSTQLLTLFDLIRSNEILDDNAVQIHIYNGLENTNAYKKLKQRLRERITDHTVRHGISYKNLDNYSLQYRKCMQQSFAVKTLALSNARSASAYIGENTIRTTIKNEFTDLSMLLASELYYYYSVIDYNPRKMQKYKGILANMKDLYEKELTALDYYCDLRIGFGSSRGSLKEKYLSKAIAYSSTLQTYLKSQNTSYQLVLISYLVLAMRYELTHDYYSLLNICDLAIDTFKKRKVSRKVAIYLFDTRRIICYIQFKRYKNAEQIAESYFEQMTPGHFNWFVLKSYVLLSRLHANEYQRAYEVMHEVSINKAYKNLPKVYAQTWFVYEAHIHFLISIQKINVPKNHEIKFRLYKFLNDIPIFSKDKRGLNIAILIVHVLMLLKQRRYSDIIDRVDALNQYCHRHLRKDETFRSNCLIKMLLKVAKADFNRKRAERYSEPYLSKLRSSPLLLSDQNIEVEIIPYEPLWNMVLDLLD